MHSTIRKRSRIAAALAAPAILALLAGCSADGGKTGTGSNGNNSITLKVATSQPEATPNFYCGVKLLKERLEKADIGFDVELYPSSQLGADTERFAGVQAGDIDIDLQGGSGLSTSYEPIGVMDAAYVFNDVDHAFKWLDEKGPEFFKKFDEATGVTIVDAWYFGTRTFTATEPIRNPSDLGKLQIRFPDSPQFLANAKAMGANPVAVASEEVYLALQQGIAQGQENPIVATHSQSYDEITKVVSLTNHQIGTHYIAVSDKTIEKLNKKQKDLLFKTIHEIRPENRKCVEEETNKILDEYRASDDMTVIEEDEVDRQAFIDKAEKFFLKYYKGEELELYKNIREMAS